MLKTERPLKSFQLHVDNFDLKSTLECGQVFRWAKVDRDEYLGVVGPSMLRIRQDKNKLIIRTQDTSASPSFVTSYFDLDLDLAYIYNTIRGDKYIESSLRRFKGLRIIRQPLWECLASFIISAYNNIPRIKGIIYNISRSFGGRLVLGDEVSYSFPSAEVLADSTPNQLRRCGAGFRTPFLKKTAQTFARGNLDVETLKTESYAQAKENLMQLDGVGQKVADCVLLYAIGRFEAFPVDVWIKRIVEKLYFKSRKTTDKRIREFAGEYFGEYAGYAQQYLYHYERSKGIK
ncbi:MAG: DNA-3-methyladenine glycosylase 2 family protein [Candidatus Omnitrophica bacterium]|nr:DNA-3-methyladenine glycosylase 2 family protein [Candidatus Omnitrophota bacterium]